MELESLEKLAEGLLSARRNPSFCLDTSSYLNAPHSINIDDAYRIQALVHESMGEVFAWKVSIDDDDFETFGAPIYAANVFGTNSTLVCHSKPTFIEAELGFELASDIVPQSTAYSAEQVLDLVAGVRVVIEVVESRLERFLEVDKYLRLADHQVNGALVLGEVVKDWRSLDFDSLEVVLYVNGSSRTRSKGWQFKSSPFELLAAAANSFSSHCGGLKAGQIITTGSYTGLTEVVAGDIVEAKFKDIGSVMVSF